MTDLAYPTLVYAHLLLFVLWLGADVGVFLLGQHFRKRTVYTLDQRIALLKLLVIVDLTPRTAWALMVPLSLTVSYVGGWWDLPVALVWVAWAIAAFWLWLVFDAHAHDMTPRAARNRHIPPAANEGNRQRQRHHQRPSGARGQIDDHEQLEQRDPLIQRINRPLPKMLAEQEHPDVRAKP